MSEGKTQGRLADGRAIFRRPILAIFVFCAVATLALVAAMTPFGDFAQAGMAFRFVLLGLASGLTYCVAVYYFGAVPARWRKAVFWGLAITLRLAIFPMAPGDDIWRYLWEGSIQLQGYNPYVLAPDAVELASLRPEWWSQINHPEWATIYPPGAQVLFLAMAWLSPTVGFFKLVFLFADLVIVFFVLRMHTGSRRYRDTAWYAWNPLVVYSFAGGGHFDSVMLALLSAAMYALHRANPMGRTAPSYNWAVLSGFLLGFAISVKVVPVLCVPLWFLCLGRRWFAIIPGLLLPSLLALLYGFPAVDVFGSLGKFAEVARTNDLVWWVADAFGEFELKTINRVASGLIVLLSCVFSVVFARNWRRGILWIMGTALLLSPIAHAWYLTWVLPAASWRRAYPWFVFSVSMFVYFLLWEPRLFGEAWSPSAGHRIAILAPPLLAMVALQVRRHLHSRS